MLTAILLAACCLGPGSEVKVMSTGPECVGQCDPIFYNFEFACWESEDKCRTEAALMCDPYPVGKLSWIANAGVPCGWECDVPPEVRRERWGYCYRERVEK